MSASIALNAFALASLIPAAVVPLRTGAGRGAAFWAAVILAVAGPVLWSAQLFSGRWQTDLGTALWVSIAASAILFALLAALTRQGWRLAPLLMPYLAVLGLLASVVRGDPRPMSDGAPAFWLDLHILVGVLTYALLTLAAVSSLAAFLQEGALKRKRPTPLTRLLPSVLDGEVLSGRLLLACEAVLGVGLISGMVTHYAENGTLIRLDHKSLLSVAAFVLIGALLAGHRVCGVRGRVAARVVLVAYLSLTLGYLGVKFVTQVLL